MGALFLHWPPGGGPKEFVPGRAFSLVPSLPRQHWVVVAPGAIPEVRRRDRAVGRLIREATYASGRITSCVHMPRNAPNEGGPGLSGRPRTAAAARRSSVKRENRLRGGGVIARVPMEDDVNTGSRRLDGQALLPQRREGRRGFRTGLLLGICAVLFSSLGVRAAELDIDMFRIGTGGAKGTALSSKGSLTIPPISQW